jgi:hypothetical protein
LKSLIQTSVNFVTSKRRVSEVERKSQTISRPGSLPVALQQPQFAKPVAITPP